MLDVVREEVGAPEVVQGPGLSGVRAEGEGVHAPGAPQLVQHLQVRVYVVAVVGERRVAQVVVKVPLDRLEQRLGARRGELRFGLVVHHVEPHHLLEEAVHLGMGVRVHSGLEEGQEDVV